MSATEQPSTSSGPPGVPHALPGEAGPRRRRWLKISLAMFFIGPVVLLAIAPTIFAWSPLRHEFPRVRLRGFTGNIRVGRASLSWFGPTILEDLELDDLDGKVFTHIDRYTEWRSVYDMIFHRNGPVKIKAEHPEITVALRPDGSNVEEALRPVLDYMERRPKRERTVEVVDGILQATDTTNDRNALWKNISLNSHTDPQPGAENTFHLVATLADAPEARPLDLELQWFTATASSDPGNRGRSLRMKTEKLPLRALDPLLSRVADDLELSGTLTADFKLQFESRVGAAPLFDMNGHLALHQLELAAASRLGPDRFHLDELDLRGKASSDGALCMLEGVAIRSDLGELSADGKIPVGAFENFGSEEMAERLQQGDFQLDGHLDLVRIAERLPHTLGLRSGARITDGRLHVDVACHPRNGNVHWQGKLDSSRLAGEIDQQSIVWERPIAFEFEFTREPERFAIDKFVCQSDVLQLTAHGDTNAAHLEGSCDLVRLAEQLGQFFELRDRHIQGTLVLTADLKRPAKETVAIQAESTITNFSTGRAGQSSWTEPRVVSQLDCAFQVEQLRPRKVERLLLTISGEGENDSLSMSLVEPVDLREAEKLWTFAVESSGDIERWRTRLRGTAPPSSWNLTGTMKSTGRLQISHDDVRLDELKSSLTALHLTGDGIDFLEPVAQLTGSGQWNRNSRELRITGFELAAASGKLSGRDIVSTPTSGPLPSLAGQIMVDSDLALLNPPDGKEDERPWGGTIHGNLTFIHEDGQSNGDLRIDVRDLLIRGPRTKLVERRRGDIEQITVDAPPIEVPRPRPGEVLDRRTRRAYERAEREARREMERRDKAARKLAEEIVLVPTVEWRTLWSDPHLTLTGSARFGSSPESIEIVSVGLETAGLTWTAHGRLSELSSRRVIDLDGDIEYDMPQLLERMEGPIGRFVKLTGREHRGFSLHGPLRSADGNSTEAIVPADLKGSLGVGWQKGTLFGLDAGPGSIDMRLENSVLALQPFDFPLSSGHIMLAPEVHLGSRPAMLHLPAGPVIENLALTQEECEAWLKYIAPVLSEATRAEGRFSLALDESRLPLSDLASGQMSGQLQIDNAQVLPGPMFAELAGFLGQIEASARGGQSGGLLGPDRPLLVIDPQTVRFQLQDRRLYHSPMTFNVKGVPVRTRGSVGADQSLDLLAEIMFPAPWARRVPLIAHLDGKVFEVPIRGTLRHPKIDGRAIGKAWQEFGLDVLDNLLNGGLIPR